MCNIIDILNKNKYIFKNADALIELKKLEDESIDLIITDPPYGINYKNNRRNKDGRIKTENGIANDANNLDFVEKVLKESYRLLKDGRHFYWFGRFDTLPEQIILMKKIGFKIKNQLIWLKNNHGTGDLFHSYASKYECIIYAVKKTKKTTKLFKLQEVNGKKRHTDILEYPKVPSKKRIHDHQKPVELIEFLIKKSSLENEIILDPFIGSGTTIIAGLKNNRKVIGYEIDKEIYELAKKEIQKKLNIK